MNLLYAEIVDVGVEDGMRFGNVRVSGAMKKVPLDLIPGAECGDTILMCDGVAIGTVEKPGSVETPSEPVDSIGFRHSSFVI
jgi:hydrogenase maturation factor